MMSHLGKAIGMRPENGDISRLRIRIVKRDILLHGQVQSLFLLVGRGRWVFPDVFAWDQVFDDAKGTGGRRRSSHDFVGLNNNSLAVCH